MEQNKQDILTKKETEKMCLSGDCELGKMCSTEDFAPCGDCVLAESHKIRIYRLLRECKIPVCLPFAYAFFSR